MSLGAEITFGGTYDRSLEILTNDPAHHTLRVPITLEVTGTPVLTLAADTLDFGTVFVGDSASRALQLHSTGTDTLQVASAEMSGGFGVAAALPVALGDNEAYELNLQIAPTQAGPLEGTLTLATNDPSRGTVTVVLRAEAVEPPVMRASRDSLTATLPRRTTAADTLTLYNDGGSDLTFRAGVRSADGAESSAGGPPRVLVLVERRPWGLDVAGLIRARFGAHVDAGRFHELDPYLYDYDAVVTVGSTTGSCRIRPYSTACRRMWPVEAACCTCWAEGGSGTSTLPARRG